MCGNKDIKVGEGQRGLKGIFNQLNDKKMVESPQTLNKLTVLWTFLI